MSGARAAAVVLAVAIVIVALGYFLSRGLHPPTHAPGGSADAGGASGGGSARDQGAHGTPGTRPDGGRGAHARVILSAPWGAGAGQLGHRSDPESVAEGPMSFFVDARGVAVLDNVNRRVARFDAQGRPLPPIALDTDAAQDLARARDRLAVLDRLHDKRVTLYDDSGAGRAAFPLAAAGIADGAAATGIFSDGDGALFVEREHKAWTRLAAADGTPDAAHTSAPGRPTRAGKFVAAAIVDRAAGQAQVSLNDDIRGDLVWQVRVDFGAPILFVALLDGDASGRIYVGAHTGHESAQPPYAVTDETLVIVALTADGNEAGRLTLPAPPPREESFRDLYVGDDGTIYWMRRTAAGVVVEAYRI
jgi:hypothetical protein